MEVVVLIEVVVESGVDRAEFLQCLHLAEALHVQLSLSKRKVRVLDAVVQPAVHFLFPGTADLLQSDPIGSQSIGDDRPRVGHGDAWLSSGIPRRQACRTSL